jgi:alpha-galactosidase
MKQLILVLSAMGLSAMPGHSQVTNAPATASLDLWKNDKPPFYFKYDGKESPAFIASWQKTEAPVTPSEGGETHHYIYTDPATKLKIAADVRTFTDFDAIEWILHFTNDGTSDTPIIEGILPLASTLALTTKEDTIHYARGDNTQPSDFEPQEEPFPPGKSFQIQSVSGCSSKGVLPFYNVDGGDSGIICGIGWSGDWKAFFARDPAGKSVDLCAGMQKTHLLLHPGESIRTPRILLLNWKGGTWLTSQNLWRRLMFAHYSPKDSSGKLALGPLCNATLGRIWGHIPVGEAIAMIKTLRERQLPIDVYWLDAGWYGDPKTDWITNMGNWDPNPELFPQGLKPLGDAAKQANMKLLVWLMSEVASPGTKYPTEHPDWYLKLPNGKPNSWLMLNDGNPAAWTGLVNLVSDRLTESGATWFRNDSMESPGAYWPQCDTPDRVGMTEIRYIEGFYSYWDELLGRHPGLSIDDCSMRQDIETMSRSYDLWRTDMAYGSYEPAIAQMQTQGISLWEPLSAGVFNTPRSLEGTAPIYAFRGTYCAALRVAIDNREPELLWFKKALDEYVEVRPYFYGDFYPMLSYSRVTDGWTAWQWDRPEHKDGIFMFLRRKNSPFVDLDLTAHGIDPKAQYEVESRTDFAHQPARTMSGADLAHMRVTIPDQPGSLLILYHQK